MPHNCNKAVLTNTYGELLLQIFIQHACHIFQYILVSHLGCFIIYLISSMLSSERAVFRLPEFSLFLFRLVSCKRHFVTFSWIVFLKGGAWLNRCWNPAWTAMYLFFEEYFYKKSSFFSWYLTHCSLESPPKNVFSNIFISILCPELYNYDPWNSLLICQFLYYPINKAIALSNQQLVKFYENNNLWLHRLQTFFKEIYLKWGIYLKHPV